MRKKKNSTRNREAIVGKIAIGNRKKENIRVKNNRVKIESNIRCI